MLNYQHDHCTEDLTKVAGEKSSVIQFSTGDNTKDQTAYRLKSYMLYIAYHRKQSKTSTSEFVTHLRNEITFELIDLTY